MSNFAVVRAAAAAVAVVSAAAVLCCAAPAAAAPDTDERGFVDSTARCEAPDVAVAFGRTAASRVAICQTPDGRYQYRGVRLRDGATLIAPAALSGGVVFIAERGASTYTVSSSSLVVSSGGEVVRREPMLSYHRAGDASVPTEPTSTVPTPLPPPLPAEVGGSG